MVKVKKEHFKVFKKEYKRRVKQFGINDWQIYIDQCKLDNARACLARNLKGRAATAWLTTEWDEKIKEKDLKATAKHEALHLLIGRVAELAQQRFVSSSEFFEAEEELVQKLDRLIR